MCDSIISSEHELHQIILSWLRQNIELEWVDHLFQDSKLILTKLKILIYEHISNFQLNQNRELNIQQLYGFINDHFFEPTSIYTIIQPELLKKGNFFSSVIVSTVAFFVKQWRDTQKMQNGFLQQYTHKQGLTWCLCSIKAYSTEYSLLDFSVCFICGELFHNSCFFINENIQPYECPNCFLLYCFPDHQVDSQIFRAILPPIKFEEKNLLSFPLQNFIIGIMRKGFCLQLRCSRVSQDRMFQYQIVWPQSCEVWIDQTLVTVIKPLPQNSSLKRRHDSPVSILLKDLKPYSKIRICQQFVGCSNWHFISLVSFVQKNQKELFSQIYQNPSNKISQQQSRQLLKQFFNLSISNQNCLSMNMLKISNRCQFYRSRIDYPSRSRFCTSHYQPYDLYSFVCSSVRAKGSIKRWKCPICGVRSYHIMRDLYLQSIMTKNEKESQDWLIDSDGLIVGNNSKIVKNQGIQKKI